MGPSFTWNNRRKGHAGIKERLDKAEVSNGNSYLEETDLHEIDLF